VTRCNSSGAGTMRHQGLYDDDGLSLSNHCLVTVSNAQRPLTNGVARQTARRLATRYYYYFAVHCEKISLPRNEARCFKVEDVR